MRDEPGPVERRANPITPANPIPRRTLTVRPAYPPEAAAIEATARVTLRVTLDEIGRVAEMRAVNVPLLVFPGIPTEARALQAAAYALTTAAADAVRQWQYDSPADPPISFNVTFQFQPGVEPAPVSQDAPFPRNTSVATVVLPTPTPQAPQAPIVREPDGAVRVGGSVRPPRRLKHVAPVYPQTDAALRPQGTVVIEARIGTNGRVTDTRVLGSIPGLDQAALDAVRQWEFEPMLLNGEPVPVIMAVAIYFSAGP